ncbi:putative leucine-rich repeat-containing protein DDB_G0290503 [Chironomus tepperi]|uniref:putative leucine-rich repeat-containing protein DDB_G0290503 n=1 Tax=Chironomus tepperi TaxID=113505 RepID=UPI00391F0DD4
MAKILMLLICAVGLNLRLSTSTNIECEYKNFFFEILKRVYCCSIIKDPIITTQEEATVTSISGYNIEESDADVDGFIVQFKTINYFPRGLETYFNNLIAIVIYKCNLMEVHQEDLKPFSNLVELRIQTNSIEVLEEGLFDFNPDLEFIALDSNKIVHIEPNIFDHLTKLSSLYLQSNSCITKYAQNSTSDVKDFIKSVKVQCINSEFSSFKEQLESLDNDSKTLNFEKFTEKLLNFEKTFKSSKFSNFRPLNSKFDALKNLKIENFISNLISNVNTKVSNLSDLVTDVHNNVNDIKSCKTSFDGFDSVLNDLKSGQTSIKRSINNECSKYLINQVLSGQNNLKSSVDTLSTSLNLVKNDISRSMVSLESSVCTQQSLIEVKDIQKIISDSVSDIYENSVRNEIEFGNFQYYFNVSIDNLHKSIQKSVIDPLKKSKFEGNILKKTSDLDKKLSNMTDLLISLDGFGSALNALESGQNGIKGSINNVCTKASIDQVQSDQTYLKYSVGYISSFLILVKNEFNTSIKSLESSVCTKQSIIEVKDIQKIISDSVIKTEVEFGNFQNHFNASIDNLQISLQQGLTDLKTSTHLELATLEESTDALISLTSKGLSDMKSSLHNFKKATDQRLSSIDTSIDDLKTSTREELTSFNDSISSSLKSSHDQLKSTQDDMKSSIKDIEAALSDLKTSQNDHKLIINKIKDSQNDVKIQTNSMKVQMSEYIEDKLKSFGEKIDGQLSDFKVEMRKELTNTQQKITTTIESLLEQKLEKILTDKLTEIFNEKFTNVIGFN